MSSPRRERQRTQLAPSIFCRLRCQIPWLENAFIKENILFGLPYLPERYDKVLHACVLIEEIEILDDRDETEIGASGINLSGGQRWRVSLARAFYSRAGILILDDVLSAVDGHVGRHILEQGLTGELGAGRTRILVTHHIDMVRPLSQYVVRLIDGSYRIEEKPSHPTETISRSGNGADRPEGPSHDIKKELVSDVLEREMLKRTSLPFRSRKAFIQEEFRERGRISWTTYRRYFSAFGGVTYWVLTIGFFVMVPVVVLARAWWLKVWTESYQAHIGETLLTGISTSQQPNDVDAHDYLFYLCVYLIVSFMASIVACINMYLVSVGCLRGSRKLFENIMYVVLRARLRWHDTVPVGRVLSRIVTDFGLLDSRVPNDLLYFGSGLLNVGGISVASVLVSPYMIFPGLIFGVICYRYSTRYLTAARVIKRLESSSRSPILKLCGSVLTGISTIRSFDKSEDYVHRMFELIDCYGRCTWALMLTTGWMAFRLGMAGSAFALCVAAVIAIDSSIDASLAGFALCFALEYSSTVIQAVRRYTDVELDMNCAERILEYVNMDFEDQGSSDGPCYWPLEGRISFKDLEVSYTHDLPPALTDVNFIIKPSQRVGVVGRTGSGKTSLTLAIFRFLSPSKGSITLNGVNIADIPLQHLRRAMSIIPQDPILFSGTLRSNIDPFGQHSDAELCDVLQRVHFLHSSNALPRQSCSAAHSAALNLSISPGGRNLSHGQRQLLCLARAVLMRSCINVLDEATSAVDMKTDTLIQKSLREEFQDSTMLVIAHRLSTIVDFDKVLVLSEGKVVEYDSPKVLWKQNGMFARMLQESGERDLLIRVLAD